MERRFYQKVNIVGPIWNGSNCWVWLGAKVSKLPSKAYGQYWDSGLKKNVLAHRYAYERTVGPIPTNLEIDHLCRNTACVNPSHLEPVTRSVNTRRGISKDVTASRNKAITHCPRGHEYNENNTRFKEMNGGLYVSRICKACHNSRTRKFKALKRASVRKPPLDSSTDSA